MKASRAFISLLAGSLLSPALAAVTPLAPTEGGGRQSVVTVTETSIQTVTMSEACQVSPSSLKYATSSLTEATRHLPLSCP